VQTILCAITTLIIFIESPDIVAAVCLFAQGLCLITQLYLLRLHRRLDL
jgi:hypothetical protein